MIKDPFIFEYTTPLSDWYTVNKVTINWSDYVGFVLTRRFGSEFELWVSGIKTEENGRYCYKEVELGCLSEGYIKEFIKWCEFELGGRLCNKIADIRVISADISIFNVAAKINELRN